MEENKLNTKQIRLNIDKEVKEDKLIEKMNNQFLGKENCKKKQDINTNFDDAEKSVEIFVKQDNCSELKNSPAKEKEANTYEYVNHPSHYNNYSVEVIEMMLRIYGPQKAYDFCEMNAFKYRMRMGTKLGSDISQDLNKEKWYLKKAKEIKEQFLL